MGNITKQDIINTVCKVCGVAPDDLKRRTREQDIVMARHFIAHYMYLLLNVNLRTIAAEIGVCRTGVYKPLFHNTIKTRSVKQDILNERYSALQEIFFHQR